MFPQGKLTMLCTDLREPESLILRLAESARAQNPARFAGKKPGVFFRLNYVPPYEKFQELRLLLLRVKEAKGMRAEFRGVVAIDVTEWLGHEGEEFFTVILKYLYDHRNSWMSAFVLCNSTETQQRKLAVACAAYISPVVEDVSLFFRNDRLARMLQLRFHAAGRSILRSTLNRLAETLTSPELAQVRSLTLLDRVVEDLAAMSAQKKVVNIEIVQKYLADPYSTLTMLMGRTEYKEENTENGIDNILL